MNEIQVKTAQLLAEIQVLAYTVNTTTKHCVFTNFSGHVNELEVMVAENKKKNLNGNMVARLGTYVPPKTWGDTRLMLEKLENIKTELNQLLQTKEAKSI